MTRRYIYKSRDQWSVWPLLGNCKHWDQAGLIAQTIGVKCKHVKHTRCTLTQSVLWVSAQSWVEGYSWVPEGTPGSPLGNAGHSLDTLVMDSFATWGLDSWVSIRVGRGFGIRSL